MPRWDEGLLLPNLDRLDATGGELPAGRGVMCLFVVRLRAGDGEKVAMSIGVGASSAFKILIFYFEPPINNFLIRFDNDAGY